MRGRDQPAADRRRRPRADRRRPARRRSRVDARPDPAQPGVREPAEQRRQVHRRRADRSGSACARRVARRDLGARHRRRHRGGDAAPRVRDVRAGATARSAARRTASGSGCRWCAASSRCTAARVEARSDGIGRGSEFIVRLPVAIGEQRATARPGGSGLRREPGAAVGARRRRQPGRRRQPRDALALDGRRRRASSTTADRRWRRSRAQRPDVALLDIGMPLMDGYELARRIRERPDAGEIVLIALTGWGQDGGQAARARGRLRSPRRQAGRRRRAARADALAAARARFGRARARSPCGDRPSRGSPRSAGSDRPAS